MDRNRRRLLVTAGLGAAGLGAGVAATEPASARGSAAGQARRAVPAAEYGLLPDTGSDITAEFQAAVDATSAKGAILELAPGRYVSRKITLRPGTVIVGAGPATRLISLEPGPLLEADGGLTITLADLEIDGVGQAMADPSDGLLALTDVAKIDLTSLVIRASRGRGIVLTRCGGSVSATTVTDIAHTGVFALDSRGLVIERCTLAGCGDNGIQVWRSTLGEDGTQVIANRITNIRSDSGGTGQNGNGINVFRAGSVTVHSNRITDCAYSAIRGNSASNILMTGNHVERIGEVALYAEFAFQGAVIANNNIDRAATGISVTNFNDGGRLAVVQGNLIRNLFRREAEPVDNRGNGIAVEADAAISGNTIEGAPTAGIWLGWGKYLRDVSATGNVVRDCGNGIVISGDRDAGKALISQNLFANVTYGAIRLADLGTVYGGDLIKSNGTDKIMLANNLLTT
jgi:uncharacterized secreted repeat protein (TIGR03808 family)